MKIRNPKSRFDLQIARNYYVLDVGGGNNPYPKANIVADKFLNSNYHRSGNLNVLKTQQFIEADGEKLPFIDKTFDYVFSSHVLEHVENPATFLIELSRVGKRGYIEGPSLIGEFLIPKESHKWVLLELDGKIVLMEKEDISFNPYLNFGDLFQKHIAPNSIEFQILMRTYPDLFTVRYEWKDEIDFVVNPTDSELRSYFTSSWDEEKILSMFKRKSRFEQITSFLLGLTELASYFLKSIGRWT